VIIWQLLTHGRTYTDHGADYYTRRDDPEPRAARLARQLEALGYTVAPSPTT
jgi:transposase